MPHWLCYLKSTPIANTGSVARDHLANERTFLDWTRTGLGLLPDVWKNPFTIDLAVTFPPLLFKDS
jgi:uncharacterized membrane protein YidH (DUF202 family)